MAQPKQHRTLPIPMGDRILIQRLEPYQDPESLIIVPEIAKEKATEAIVLAVGTGQRLDDGTFLRPLVDVGDHVLFAKYSGSEVRIGKDDCLIIREDDILCKVPQ